MTESERVMDKEHFRNELVDLLNIHSAENGSGTPDFILARYMMDCLEAWDKATQERDHWFRFKPWPRESKTAKGYPHTWGWLKRQKARKTGEPTNE